MLVAPVVASGRRWVAEPGWAQASSRLLWATLAFALGHSLSLCVVVAFDWQFASGPVELLVAVSILITAIHACRPIFPRHEAWMAGGFGLVHGAAFSSVIGGFVLDPSARLVALLGFTAGIEVLQLLLVSLVLPLLMALRATAAFNGIRLVGAGLCATAAVAWIVQRLQAGVAPVLIVLEDPASRGPLLAASAAAVAMACLIFNARALRRKRGS